MTEPATPRLVPYGIEFAPREWFEVDDDEPIAASLDDQMSIPLSIADLFK